MGKQHLCRCPGRFRGQVVDPHHLIAEQDHKSANHHQSRIVDQYQLLGILLRLFPLTGTHALTNDGDDAKTDGIAHQILKRHQIARYGIAGDSHSSQGRHQTLQK